MLPPLLVLTDRTQCAEPLPNTVAAAVKHGARAVVLREKDLPDRDRDQLAAQLRAVLDPVGGLLIRAGAAGCDGAAVHLASKDSMPRPRPVLVGRSCHSRHEVMRARRERCDYVTISPVFPTPSKPGYGPPLGPDVLAALITPALPAFALGGIRPTDVADCLAAGAHGIAVMGPIMRDPTTVPAYLAALEDRSA